MKPTIHKNSSPSSPRLSFILLDWGCRERFSTLDWLHKQSIPKDDYELIWVELYDWVVEEVMDKADIVVTCHQSGMYHKHLGYNVGLLQARGDLICVCDSDAVFPSNFVRSVFDSFFMQNARIAEAIVLMHYEWRTSLLYPNNLTDAETLKDASRWQWWPLIINEGACVTFRRKDAIRFGGFDEHKSYRGYMCGPYELAWRLVNAGWPEVWHDSSIALWHFAHPDPIGTNGQRASLKQLLEKAYPHLQGHALEAVNAFSTGRFQPLQENPQIWKLRMEDRRIGSELESRYSNLTGQKGFPKLQIIQLWFALIQEIFVQYTKNRFYKPLMNLLRFTMGEHFYQTSKKIYYDRWAIRRVKHDMIAEHPVLLSAYRGYNLIKMQDKFYAARHGLTLDLTNDRDRQNPELLVSTNYFSLLKIIQKLSNKS